MGARTKARKRALDVLFESELQGLTPGASLAHRRAEAEQPLNPYTVRLVEGVAQHRDDLDQIIAGAATGWTLDRMPVVDRNLLRIGVYELRYVDEVPAAVTLSEAVSLAGELSTAESPAFVNGVLAKIAATAQEQPATG